MLSLKKFTSMNLLRAAYFPKGPFLQYSLDEQYNI